jgi:hypothetical protein
LTSRGAQALAANGALAVSAPRYDAAHAQLLVTISHAVFDTVRVCCVVSVTSVYARTQSTADRVLGVSGMDVPYTLFAGVLDQISQCRGVLGTCGVC